MVSLKCINLSPMTLYAAHRERKLSPETPDSRPVSNKSTPRYSAPSANAATWRTMAVLSAKPTKPQSRAYCLESRWAIFSDCCLWVGTQVLT